MAPEDMRKLQDLDQARNALAESRRDMQEMRELERVPLRSVLYGRSRMNQWPLWVSWLLAPSSDNRRIVRELMQLRRAGVDV